jgi:hypothetical protein
MDVGLLGEDKYLAEVNLEWLETTSGEHQHYWLLVIKTMWKAKILQEQTKATANSQQNHTRDGQVNINFWHLKEVRDVFSSTHGLFSRDCP